MKNNVIRVFIFVIVMFLISCNCKKEQNKLNFPSTIHDKKIIASIIETYNHWKIACDSTGVVNINIWLENDTLYYGIVYRNELFSFLYEYPPCFVFNIESITVTVTSNFLNQFKIPDTILSKLYRSKFRDQWDYYLKYKQPIIPNIDDSPATLLVYYKGRFIRKFTIPR